MKRLPKATQPLRGGAGLEPDLLFPIHRPQLELLRAEEISLGEGGRGKWPPFLSRTGWVPQVPECKAKAKMGGRYQLAEPSRDKWAAPGDSELPIGRGVEGSDAHVPEWRQPLLFPTAAIARAILVLCLPPPLYGLMGFLNH